MVNSKYNSATEAFDEIATKVRKVGGDNACKFQANAENIAKGIERGDQQILVFSAIRSSDPSHSIYKLKTSEKNGEGFNTTSHLIEMAKYAQSESAESALDYLDIVLNFTRLVVNEEIEPEFQEGIHALIKAESKKMIECVLEASDNVANISVFGKEYVYKSVSGEYISFTGFGEVLCQKIYAAYLKAKGFKVAELDPEKNSMQVFGDDPVEAMKREGEKIDELRNIYALQLRDVLERKPDLVVTGGWEAVLATQRSYSDKKAALIAQALQNLGKEVLYVNEKKDEMRSADPGVLGSENGSKPICRMNYRFLKELTGSRGADTTVLHSDVAEMLESRGIPTVIKNPYDDSKEGTLITTDYMPEEGNTELVASKPIKAALTIKSGNMPDQEGVVATISQYFANLSIDTVHTTNNTVFLTFDGDVTEEKRAELQKILDEKFTAKYKLDLRKDLAFVFCLGNNMDAVLENALGTLALRNAGIRPLRLHAVDEESVASFLVEEKDRLNAVRILHKSLITNHE